MAPVLQHNANGVPQHDANLIPVPQHNASPFPLPWHNASLIPVPPQDANNHTAKPWWDTNPAIVSGSNVNHARAGGPSTLGCPLAASSNILRSRPRALHSPEKSSPQTKDLLYVPTSKPLQNTTKVLPTANTSLETTAAMSHSILSRWEG